MQSDTKLLEVRDRATFIPILATRVVDDQTPATYLLRRAGYIHQGIVLVYHLNSGKGTSQPLEWLADGTRTMHLAHEALVNNWGDYENGDVVDVEFILGEADKPKVSEQVGDTTYKPDPELPSYHDVVVEADGQIWEIFNCYGVQLTCNKAGGWELWTHGKTGGEELIGGEYDTKPFAVRLLDGTKICGPTKRTTPEDDDS